MIYELHFHPPALKEWKKLAKNLQEHFKKVLKQRLKNPHVASASLRETLKECYCGRKEED
ncbi:mRNA interferase RelE [Legionella gratiana]|uniref:mRNA interferase RelE n=1 Tax=Legionella gratiana TaxID=45066 RepID=A0ABR5R2Q0_9GAMM|nr:type II toxin-antitoxin system RelE/ParE family toxin [Legionella gratiana]KTD10836.1 mRNA interferase RelE [Legionella gratiana]